MRDYLVTAIVVGMLPWSFRQPFIGVLVFSWLAYMRVQNLCFGFAQFQRFSLYVAVAMFAGFLIFERGRWFLKDKRNTLMIALGVLVTASLMASRWGVDERDVDYLLEFLKILAVAMFTSQLVNTWDRLRAICWVIALSLGFYGFKAGLFGILSGGASQILRGPGGLLADNNDFSLALTMNVPFLFYLGMTETRLWARRGLFATLALTIVTIVLTHSRGGFLAMCATLGLITWRSRNRVLGFALAIVAGVVFLLVAPADVMERLSSIKDYEADRSAQARLHTWAIAVDMVGKNPLLGVGFRNFREAYMVYDPSPLLKGGKTVAYVAHNSYLQISAESGIPALIVYLAIFASTFLLLRRVRIAAERRLYTTEIQSYVRMFEASLLGFLVGATFLNRAHFDLAYHVVGIAIAFAAMAFVELDSEESHPSRSGGGTAGVTSMRGFGSLPRVAVPLGSRGGRKAREKAKGATAGAKPHGAPRLGFGRFFPPGR